MKIQSLWTHGDQSPDTEKTWLGSLVATVEIDFTPASVMLTLGSPPQQLLEWLEANATGKWAVQYLRDGRAVIATNTKYDAFVLRGKFQAHLDFSVVSTDRSPKVVAGLLKNFSRMRT